MANSKVSEKSYGGIISILVFVLGLVMLVAMFFIGIIGLAIALICFGMTLILGILNRKTGMGFVLMILGIAFIIITLIILMSCMVTVPAGYKCVITSAPDGPEATTPVHVGTVINEGWSFNPYYLLCSKEMIKFNNQAVVFTGSDTADDNMGSIMVSSSDGVSVYMDFTVTYNIPEDQVGPMRMAYGDYRHAVIEPICRSVPRDAASHYTAFQMYSDKRTAVEDQMRDEITAALAEKGITVTNFALRDVRPPQTFIDAIEAQKVAQQQMQTAEYVAQAKIISAQGNLTATLINANATAQAVVIQATADMQSMLLKANGSAGAIQQIADMIKAQYPDSNETAYLQYLFIQALTDPNCGINFWLMDGNNVPILLNTQVSP